MNNERRKIVKDLVDSWDGEDLEHLIWEARTAVKAAETAAGHPDVTEAARQGFYRGDVGYGQMPSSSDLTDADDAG